MTDAARPGTPEVELRGIRKLFGSTVAVDGLDLAIGRGEFFAILGPSGCGKTTTLRMVAGLERPTAGAVAIRGRDVTALPPYKRDIGMVFQDYALFPHLTVFENIAFGLRMRRWSSDQGKLRARVQQMLELIQLPDVGGRYPRPLSGGQQQRIALARAIAPEPAVLLLDEPLSNLDLKLRQELRVEIRRIQRELGITTLFVTHDQGEALSLADRLLVMRDGRAVQLGTPSVVYEQPRNRWVASFLGDANVFSGKATDGVLVTAGGLALPLASALPARARAGDVMVAIRPEAVTLVPPDAPAIETPGARVPATVDAVVYLGAGARYMMRAVTCPSEIVFVDVAPPRLAWTPGTRLDMVFPCDKWIVFDEDPARGAS